MENQVVLKTKESDVQEFYVDVLGGKITRHFALNVEDAIKSSDIPQTRQSCSFWQIFRIISVIIFLFSFITILFSGCNADQQKSADAESDAQKAEIRAAVQQEQLELCSWAHNELSLINKKIMTLNEKIKKHEGGLTDNQNKMIDEFEVKRQSVNERVHKIKDIHHKDWEKFKISLQNDLDTVKIKIDTILAEL